MNKRFCPHCGKENIAHAAFCMYCGKTIEAPARESEQPQNVQSVYSQPQPPVYQTPYHQSYSAPCQNTQPQTNDRVGGNINGYEIVGMVLSVVGLLYAFLQLLNNLTIADTYRQHNIEYEMKTFEILQYLVISMIPLSGVGFGLCAKGKLGHEGICKSAVLTGLLGVLVLLVAVIVKLGI